MHKSLIPMMIHENLTTQFNSLSDTTVDPSYNYNGITTFRSGHKSVYMITIVDDSFVTDNKKLIFDMYVLHLC